MNRMLTGTGNDNIIRKMECIHLCTQQYMCVRTYTHTITAFPACLPHPAVFFHRSAPSRDQIHGIRRRESSLTRDLEGELDRREETGSRERGEGAPPRRGGRSTSGSDFLLWLLLLWFRNSGERVVVVTED